MTIREDMLAQLTREFAPEVIELNDVSEQHFGHAGWREGGETHFDLLIQATAFDGVSRVGRQRLVHKSLAPWLKDRVHALSMKIFDSSETVRR